MSFDSDISKINRSLKAISAGDFSMAKALLSSSPSVPGAAGVRDDDEAPGEMGGTVNSTEFMRRADEAHARGHITATHVAEAQAHINAGKRPPQGIIDAVMNKTAHWPDFVGEASGGGALAGLRVAGNR